jgi:hypothetical protein
MGVSRIDENRVSSAKYRNERGIGPPFAALSSQLIVGPLFFS